MKALTHKFEYRDHRFEFPITQADAIEKKKRIERALKALYDKHEKSLFLVGARTGAPIFWEIVVRHDKLLQREHHCNAIKLLRALGILSTSQEDNWEISSGAANLNPRDPASSEVLYFTRRGDAVSFGRAMYEGSSFAWSVHQCVNVAIYGSRSPFR